ncbi:MAG: DegV family protein [Lachnospiraceae bacterium]|nr:DegV family protein [Lachnospiraceae bacterium]
MVKIISDSTCDLSKNLIEKYNISILPLHILLGNDEYKDSVNITPDDIYKWSDKNHSTPKTSAPSLEDTIQHFKPFIDNGDEIVCFSVSKEMSTSCNVMNIAAEELDAADRIFVVDSANLSTGVGLLVIEAAIMAANGKSGKEISDKMKDLKPLVRSSFVVDTLTYLHRGGRCSSVAALAGSVLKLHPKIVVEKGKMEVAKKYRGKMDSVILSYVRDLEEQLKNAKTERVFITHSGCDEAVLDSVRSYLEELNIFNEILVTRAGGVISSHCGYGTLGVLFISNQVTI